MSVVYGWQSFRSVGGRFMQTREIVAAHSKAEVARLAGVKRPAQLMNLGSTGNTLEVQTASSKPGVIFFRDLNARREEPFMEDSVVRGGVVEATA